MVKHARKLKSGRARDARIFAVLGLISLVISILSWLATPGIGV